MSEPTIPDPPQGAAANATTEDKGSLLAGFFLAWGAMVGSWFLVAILIGVLSTLPHLGALTNAVSVLAALLPMGSVLGLLIWALVKGRTRTALGVVAAIGSMVALVLLLVAACFGLMAGGNWH